MIGLERKAANLPFSTLSMEDWRMIMTVTRRETRDTLRDWRLVFPIMALTLFFPGLLTFVAGRVVDFLNLYNSDLIAERSLPLLMLAVGFFPTSFSLVIALEVFVGEKERKSLEPLLSTPLTNRQLYVGKLLAAVAPPVMASYVGIAVYAIGVTLMIEPMASQAVVLVIVLTTIQALLMVSASVVISSQTTSTRAANMLASFIVVPVALLLQAEALLLAIEDFEVLWWIVLAVLVTTAVFIRIGVQLFNREQLLGRNIDFIRLSWVGKTWWRGFSGRQADGRYPGVAAWYRQTLAGFGELKMPATLLAFMFFVSVLVGVALAYAYPLPPGILVQLRGDQMESHVEVLRQMLRQLPLFIFAHNLRAIALLILLGTLTFGVMTILIFMLPWSIIAFITTQFAAVGENPLLFLGATIFPHGWVELPVLLLVSAAALRWQATLIAPPGRRLISELWIEAGADFSRIFVGLGIPLFFAAALLESFVTPLVIAWVYGG